MPNMYKFFLWRVAHNIIPTIQALNSRGMNLQERYFLCNNDSECLAYALLSCNSLACVCKCAPFNFQAFALSADFAGWLRSSNRVWSYK